MKFALLEIWYGIMVCLLCDYFQDWKCHFLLLSKACSGALSLIKTLHNGHSYPYIYIYIMILTILILATSTLLCCSFCYSRAGDPAQCVCKRSTYMHSNGLSDLKVNASKSGAKRDASLRLDM